MNPLISTHSLRQPVWSSSRFIGVLAFVGSWMGYMWRRPDQWFTPQFIAEDGFVFFSDAAPVGWASLIKLFAGYLYFVPRVIASLTKELPWEFLPMAYVIIACLMGWVSALPLPGLPKPSQ